MCLRREDSYGILPGCLGSRRWNSAAPVMDQSSSCLQNLNASSEFIAGKIYQNREKGAIQVALDACPVAGREFL